MREKEGKEKQVDLEQRAYYMAQPKIGKEPSKLRQQFGKGMTYFLVIAASILFYFALLRFTGISDLGTKVFHVLKPVIYGCGFAYLLNPIVKKVENILYPILEERMKHSNRAFKISRTIGILTALLVFGILITTLFNLLIPELYASILKMAQNLPRQITLLLDKLNKVQLEDSTTGRIAKRAITEGTEMFQNWVRTDLIRRANSIMSNLTVGVINVLSEIFKGLIGVIISIYLLYGKETFGKQSKKVIYSLFTPRRANIILHISNKSNEIFGGFIIGKIIDSVIIGVLCFVGLSILKMPYTTLVSVIVGVTNIIPFFGPYIGAIPSAFLIVLEDPMKGLYFILFILVLQQFDGNVLGPKILGDSTGLSAFWVIVAILIGGGLFGFVGMILGVPTFAVLYYICQMWITGRLEQKNLPSQFEYYGTKSYVDDLGQYFKEEGQKGYEQNKEEKDKKEIAEIAVEEEIVAKEILEKED